MENIDKKQQDQPSRMSDNGGKANQQISDVLSGNFDGQIAQLLQSGRSVDDIIRLMEQEQSMNLLKKVEFKNQGSNFHPDEMTFIKKYLKEDRVRNRIYVIRHDETAGGLHKGKKVSPKPGSEQRMKEVADRLMVFGVNAVNAEFFGDGETTRIIDSVNNLMKGLKVEGKKMISDARLNTTTKPIGYKPKDRKNYHVESEWTLASQLSMNFGQQLKSMLKRKTNVCPVLMIHSGNIAGLETAFYRIQDGRMTIDVRGIKEREIREFDCYEGENEVEGVTYKGVVQIINPNLRKDLLFINNKNYKTIIAELEEEGGLKDVIAMFREGKLQLHELQNYINAYFRFKSKNSFEIYKRYLLSNHNDLRKFSAVNLVINDKFEFVLDNLESIVKNSEKEESIDLIQAIFYSIDKHFSLEKCNDMKKQLLLKIKEYRHLISKINLGKLLFYINYEIHARPNINRIRENSLDKNIQSGKEMINLLELEELYGYGSIYSSNDSYPFKTPPSIEERVMDLEFHDPEKSESLPLNSFKHKYGSNFYNPLIIEDFSGSGKTIKILEIMEMLAYKEDEENEYFPVYVNLNRKKNIEEIKKEILDQQTDVVSKMDCHIVYLFDGLDESDMERDEIVKLLELMCLYYEEGNFVVLTTRPGQIPEIKDEINGNNLSRKFYGYGIKKLTLEQKIKITKDYIGEELFLELEDWLMDKYKTGITDNILILTIINNLILNNDIKEIYSIETISGFYNKIVFNRLRDWQIEKGEAIDENDVEKRIELLEKLAYQIYLEKYGFSNFENNNELTEEIICEQLKNGDFKDFSPYIASKLIKKQKIYDIGCLNLLQVVGEENNIRFIHQSFLEYFAASYIVKSLKKGTISIKYFLENVVHRLYPNGLDFVIDILKESENLELKTKIVEAMHDTDNFRLEAAITKNFDHIFAYLLLSLGEDIEGFLDIYIENERMSQYLPDVIGRYGGDNKLSLLIKYLTFLTQGKYSKYFFEGRPDIPDIYESFIKAIAEYCGDDGLDYLINSFKNDECVSYDVVIKYLIEFGKWEGFYKLYSDCSNKMKVKIINSLKEELRIYDIEMLEKIIENEKDIDLIEEIFSDRYSHKKSDKKKITDLFNICKNTLMEMYEVSSMSKAKQVIKNIFIKYSGERP